MQVGDLVRHIEHGYIGILVRQGASSCDRWLIHWSDYQPVNSEYYYHEVVLEVLCK